MLLAAHDQLDAHRPTLCPKPSWVPYGGLKGSPVFVPQYLWEKLSNTEMCDDGFAVTVKRSMALWTSKAYVFSRMASAEHCTYSMCKPQDVLGVQTGTTTTSSNTIENCCKNRLPTLASDYCMNFQVSI